MQTVLQESRGSPCWSGQVSSQVPLQAAAPGPLATAFQALTCRDVASLPAFYRFSMSFSDSRFQSANVFCNHFFYVPDVAPDSAHRLNAKLVRVDVLDSV